MTIEPGAQWGEPWPGRADREVASDAALANALLSDPGSLVAPQSGDVLRTLGLDRPREASEAHRYPLDLLLVELQLDDGTTEQTAAVAHIARRDRPLRGIGPGISLVVLNAPWLGDLRLGPKAHLNDGVADVVEGVVGLRQHREATRRARSGSHLPHPGLSTSRTKRWERRFDRPAKLWLDGVPCSGVRRCSVEVGADAGFVLA